MYNKKLNSPFNFVKECKLGPQNLSLTVRGVLPFRSSIGMCGAKGYGSTAVLVIKSLSTLAYFGHFSHK